MAPTRRELLQALRDELAGCDAATEPCGGGRFGVTVIWDGFAGHGEAERQAAVKDAAARRLGDDGAALVAYVIAWTPAEKRQYDVDKL